MTGEDQNTTLTFAFMAMTPQKLYHI